MLSVKRSMLLSMLCLSVAAVHAQENKTAPVAVFNHLSQSIQLSEATLSAAMQMSKGQELTVAFSQEFIFPGSMISNENVYENLQTVIIKSSAYNNALFQLSKQVNTNNSISYVGRIFNPGGADGYELKRAEDGSYYFQKFQTAAILQDCDLH
jgi:hypothetical protein